VRAALQNLPLQVGVAMLAGLAYVLVTVRLWDIYNLYSPINAWLIDLLASDGNGTAYQVAMVLHDAVVSVLFAAPLAVALFSFPRLNSWVCVGIAACTAVVAANLGLDWSLSLLESSRFWFESGTVALSPVVAFAGIRTLAN